MSKKYVCLYSFGKNAKGDPYKGSERDTAKLLKNGMISPLMAEGGNSVKKPATKKQAPPEVVTNLGEEKSKPPFVSQAGQVSPAKTAKKSKPGKKKATKTKE